MIDEIEEPEVPIEVPETPKRETPYDIEWCETQGIQHSWKRAGTLVVADDVIDDHVAEVRYCVNCGRVQHKVPSVWEDQ